MRILSLIAFLFCFAPSVQAENGPVQTALQTHAEDIAKPSRRTIQPVLDDLAASGLPEMTGFLEAWAHKGIVRREADGLFFFGQREGDVYRIRSLEDGRDVGEIGRREAKELKPNAGVRKLIATTLVQFQLSDPDPERRRAALDALGRNPTPELLDPLRASIQAEPVVDIRNRKEALDRLITIRFGSDPSARIAAINWMATQVSIEARAALNAVLKTSTVVGEPESGANVAGPLEVGVDLTEEQALARLAEEGLVPDLIEREERDEALIAAIREGAVARTPVAQLNTEDARWVAYERLAAAGQAKARPDINAVVNLIVTNPIFEIYDEPDPAVTSAALTALEKVDARVARAEMVDLGLDALSLGSIYFLAAIGLAITFGVMGVINMSHGEFIMIGAYTGYVVQQLVPDYTASLIIALPLAFVVAAAAGVLLERLVIRHLAHRPLETLLATFGISVALQQLFKNIFGTQAVPLTSPDWLAGAWVINDVIGISYIRIAIFVMALIFLSLLVYTLRRTRLGLEMRAVTQNPGMAASLGIDPDRVGMATFALGSGIAGVAGVAIGLFAQVTSEMGTGYIVQSFMTVVVGGVGSVFGTLAGAG
ncbi:MAG: urea ABC transporter permease subunit UrtB, partial [Boseongicola sp.]|nr:urea ABC transporter permease subunit UrtB [Boseongicola sp.]